ncbi:MAG: outer membrane protein assembly factor BamC [Azoarcus sp.]|jgi:outer membrane protein assembly factor BamC|nr:outer membrane protein assembly factor BamC [Azoarcus sp.]
MTCIFSTPVSALAVLLALTACSTEDILESKRIDYKKARPTSTLEVPPDLTAPRAEERYAVPDTGTKGAATFSDYTADRSSSPAPGSTGVLTNPGSMRIERAGSQRWLVVPGTAEAIWPQVRDFWLELGFILNIDNSEIGVLETDWRENRANISERGLRKIIGKVADGLYSTPERDKFRTRIERGEGGTVEIYVSHRGMMEIYPNESKDATIWQPRPADPELEAEMLRRLMVKLGVEEARAKTVIAQAPKATDRAQIQVTEGEAVLQVEETFDRAWRRVGLALDRVSFTVEDRDRAKGLYFVRYVDPEIDNDQPKKEKGFFSRLFSSDKKIEGAEYRLKVEGQGGGKSTVTVVTEQGEVDKSKTARRILALLQQELK